MKASHLILFGALFASAGAWAQSNPKNPDGTGTTANGSPSQVVGDTNANANNASNTANNAHKSSGKMTSKKHSKKQASRNASGTSTGGTDAGGNGTHPNTGDAVNNPGMSGTGNNSGTDSSSNGNSGNTTTTPPGQQK